MAKKDKEQQTLDAESENAEISEEMEKAYIDYAMSVIVSRALPAVEDGLKPVHRRILYAMEELGLEPKKPTKKSARIVGDVLGKLHPHGDKAVYDSLVRMAQPFSLRYPLVHGQGNFGSMDGDPPAAQRYCVTGNTRVVTEKGMEKIKNISEKEDINTKVLSKDKKINKATKLFDSGKHPTLKITTNKGYSLTGTYNHPVLTLTKTSKNCPKFKWKLMKDIEKEDIVVLDRLSDDFWPEKEEKLEEYYPKINNGKQVRRILPESLNKNFALILGLLVAEGNITENKLEFCNTDKNLIKTFQEKWKEVFPNSPLHKFKRKPSSFGKKEYFRLECHCMYVLRFLKNLGINPVKSSKKTIPELIFTSPKEIITNFLKAYFEGDGSIYYSKKSKEISCCSKNPKLIKQLQKILLRLGIESFNRYDKYKFIDRLLIRNKRNVTRFYKEIGFLSERKNAKLEFVVSNYTKDYSNTDYVPFISDFIRDLSHNEFIKKNNFDRYSNMGENYEKVCQIVSKKTGIDYSSMFKFFLTYQYLFEKVAKIEKAGTQRVYSPKVKSECHSFISNGFISHNTEAKLDKISLELLKDLDKKTVNMTPNFDNSMEEPEVLPAKLPNLLINGASGIAVGMATNIPPYNLNEVCDGIIEYIDNDGIPIKELTKIVKGPDFPTGGKIAGDMEKLHEDGKGRVWMRGKIKEEDKKGGQRLIVTEIPYQVNKSNLVSEIAELVKDKKLPNIKDIRDESAKGNIRIVIELKKGSTSKFTENRLYKRTKMQSRFDANLIALVKGKPKRLSLKDIIHEYVRHRKEVIKKRSEFELEEAENRIEVVKGLLKALKDIDNIIKTIKKSETTKDAMQNLIDKFSLTKRQSEAILNMRLSSLTSLQQNKLEKEKKELEVKIEKLKKILNSSKEILKIIKKDLKELKENYGDERRSKVAKKFEEIEKKDLIQKKDVAISISEKGYIKRQDFKYYKAQKRGGTGVTGSKLATGDFVKDQITCCTHDHLLLFTNQGRVYWLKAYKVPEVQRNGKGKPIVNLVSLNKKEKIASILNVSEFKNNSIIMATEKGHVKKLSMEELGKLRKSGKRVMNLPDDDQLLEIKYLDKEKEIMLITSKGQAIKFNSKDIRAMGRTAYGVTGVKLEEGDKVVGVEIPSEKDTLLSITKNGYGKRSHIRNYRLTRRAGKGVINMNIIKDGKVRKKSGEVVASAVVKDEDSIIVSTAKGMTIRMAAKQIRVMGRNTMGVKVVRLKQDDRVTDVVKVPEADEE